MTRGKVEEEIVDPIDRQKIRDGSRSNYYLDDWPQVIQNMDQHLIDKILESVFSPGKHPLRDAP